MGKEFAGSGTTASGIEVVRSFIRSTGIDPEGMFIEDGSGLSPLNAVNAADMVALLRYMKLKSRYFPDYLASLPGPADEGTLKNWFSDPLFISGLKEKSGSMTRVRSYAGYLKCSSGKELAFTIIINDFSGPSREIIAGIREILRETLINN